MASARPATILVVDDETNIQEALRKVLEKDGYRVLLAGHGRRALEIVRSEPVHVMISDLRMPGMTGDALLKAVKTLVPEIEVIMMTAYGTVENAVETMKLGARDFISKPLKRAVVLAAVARAVERSALVAENRELKAKLAAVTQPRKIVGNSQVMRATLEIAEQAANSSATVLLLGESGTGKELLARYIHERSPRAQEAFVATNCAALPESILESELFGHEKGSFTGATRSRSGRFVDADRGSLFLDEIGEIPLSVQVKLLRAIQEGEVEPVGGKTRSVDFRLICATNRELSEEVKQGRFRDDLFYRINVVPLRVPPLRDRLEDVPLLAEHFVRIFSARHQKSVLGFDAETTDLMMRYGWPGNVRELENAVERAVVLARGERLGVNDLPMELQDPQAGGGRQLTFSVGMPLEEVERRMIMETLKFTGGDKRLAADLLGIATRTIYRKLESGALRNPAAPSEESVEDKGVMH